MGEVERNGGCVECYMLSEGPLWGMVELFNIPLPPIKNSFFSSIIIKTNK